VSEDRLWNYLAHIRRAASDACTFVEGMSKADFMADKRTQNAVVMSLIVIGETATNVMDRYPEFAAQHPEIFWRDMRGMRNRIAHGYFDIEFDVVWDTTQSALSALLEHLAVIRENGEGDEAIVP